MRVIIMMLVLFVTGFQANGQITSRSLNLHPGDTVRWTSESVWAEPDGIPDPTITEYLLTVDSVIGNLVIGTLKEYGSPSGRVFVLWGSEAPRSDDEHYELNFAVRIDHTSGEMLSAAPDRVAPHFRMIHRDNPDPPSDSVFLASSEDRMRRSTWPQFLGPVPENVLNSTADSVVLRDTVVDVISRYSADGDAAPEKIIDTTYKRTTWTRTRLQEEGSQCVVYDTVVEPSKGKGFTKRTVFDPRDRLSGLPVRYEYQSSNFGEPGTIRVKIQRRN